MTEKARKRQATVELLDELVAAGLITMELEHRDWEGPEPRMELVAQRADLLREAPPAVSEKARWLWDQLRTGQLGGRLRLNLNIALAAARRGEEDVS